MLILGETCAPKVNMTGEALPVRGKVPAQVDLIFSSRNIRREMNIGLYILQLIPNI